MHDEVLELQNFGPILSGSIPIRKANLFFGPNNSGKSMAARLIYGMSSYRDFRSVEPYRRFEMMRYERIHRPFGVSDYYSYYLVRMANEESRDVITYHRKQSAITVRSREGSVRIVLESTKNGIAEGLCGGVSLFEN